MKIRSIAAAALVACATFSGSANAVIPLGTIDNTTATFSSGAISPGTFSEDVSFTLANPGTAVGALFGLNVVLNSTPFFTTFLNSVTLNGPGGYTSFDNNLSNGFFFTGLPAGSFLLTIAGTAGGFGGQFDGSVSAVTSAVPEASSLALALAGLGVIGLVARRRKPQ